MSLFGTAAGTDIPVEHLDYGYIGKCNSVKEVEQILKILRSGKEGHYPDLVKFTEKKLTELNPQSKLLIKSEKAKGLFDLSCEDSNDIVNQLKQWEDEMGSADSKLKEGGGREETETVVKNGEAEDLPPIRKPGTISGAAAEAKSKKSTSESQRIKSSDYRAWDKYDVEKEITKAESEEKVEDSSKVTGTSKTEINSDLSEKERNMSLIEKQRAATREREKGNEAFRSGDYQEALGYYTRSIKFHSTPAAHNNRAMAEIKLEKYPEAIADCSQVLSVEPQNTKALFRRATAYFSTKDYREAADDFESLLQLEPNNKKAQEQLNRLRREFLDPDTKQQGGEKKGRKIQIQEVEEEEDENNKEKTNGPSSVGVATPEALPPLPPHIQSLKDEGNALFLRGQYGEAELKYTAAIKKLGTDASHSFSLSTLLNNRAACHLKNGHSRACVEDCTNSLELVPVNLKAFIRRGQAYEAMEKYKHAYNDYQLALRIDNRVESVYTASSRISRMLREFEGNDWRNKLPECPEADKVMAALSKRRASLMTDTEASTDQNKGDQEEPADQSDSAETDTKQSTDQESDQSKADGVGTEEPSPSSATSGNEDGSMDLTPGDDRDSSEPTEPTRPGVDEEEGDRDSDGGSESSGESESDTIKEPVQKIPDIKPVDVTTTSAAIKDFSPHVTMSTHSVPTPVMSSSDTPPEKRKEIPPEEQFDKYKAKGNEHVKQKEFVDALRYYSMCIDTCPDKVVGYTNRAFCYLKLDSPHAAEVDCTKALELESTNIKALYRRGLARKALKKYSDSAKDLKTLVDLDPGNSVANRELTEVKQLWEKELREIQEKAASGRKSRHSSSSSVSAKKDKDRHKKSPNLVQAEKKIRETKATLDNLLKQMQAKADTQASATASSEKRGKTEGERGSDSSSKAKKKSNGSRAASSKSRSNERSSAESKKTRTKAEDILTSESSSADMTATKTTYFKKEGSSSSAKDSSGKEPKRKRIVIEEVEDSSEEEEIPSQSTSDAASTQESKPMETSPPPGTEQDRSTGENLAPYEFVQRWNAIPRTAQSIEYANLLEQIPPEKLPEVITNKLDGMMLTNIIRAIDKQFVPRKLYQLSIDVLENLCKVPRFGMNAMFLGPKEKQDLNNVFRALSEQQETAIPPPTLEGLKKSYGVDS